MMKNALVAYSKSSIFSIIQSRNSHRLANLSVPPTEEYLVYPTAATLSSALQHYVNSESPFHGQKIHTHILKTGFVPNTNVFIKLLILYLKCGFLRYARQMFNDLPQRTLSAYNYMVGGYLKQGLFQESINLVRMLIFDGQKPDGFTFSMVLKASTSGDNLAVCSDLGSAVHGQMLKSDVENDCVLYTSLVNYYVKSGKVSYARKVFDMMIEKNVICSTSMISGYMNQGSVEDAEDIFRRTVDKDVVVFNAIIEGYSKSVETAEKALVVFAEMQRIGFKPNLSTFASVIGACSALAGFEIGQQVHCQLLKHDCFANIKMGSALIDMYSKCGRIEEARIVFDFMTEKNVFSWSSMIDGYGKNGKPNEALELFHRMQECSTEPNDVTFLSALSACGHAGLVSKGRELFESMGRDYSLKPGMEHYACMVDLLGRAGSLNLAWEFVMGMPETPNTDVWAALLSSCNMHGNVEMARIAADQLFKLKSDGRPGAYVALSNTLAGAGNWDDVGKVRQTMKSRGILKDTGSSWVGTGSA